MARTVKPLTETEIKNTKTKEKTYTLSDGAGMYLEVNKNGGKYHYLIRALGKAKDKKEEVKYRRLKRRWDSLSDTLKKDLVLFLHSDDLAKK